MLLRLLRLSSQNDSTLGALYAVPQYGVVVYQQYLYLVHGGPPDSRGIPISILVPPPSWCEWISKTP